ncbi:MAG: MBL fold metallo-hydrolase [Deltaproteobacteria bacterium HGW-Deltaproteobacteria-6]|jgi:phosphoribosyl 1,2-cyclic phosphodiesterase|nr:MAG: MBL fold metallo-hydrolase [Deltaproteobacteria bacterium HGW-Deltaproteobacteria-6]
MNFRSFGSSSKGNCYLVESDGIAPLLVECGISIKVIREKLNFSLSGLAGCLISHAHGDHSKAAKDLLKAGVDIWTSEETAEALELRSHHRMNMLLAGSQECVGDWVVIPFDLHHDVPTHGFLIGAPNFEKLLFIPDTSYIRNRFEGVNIIAIECNYVADKLSHNIQSGALPQSVGRRVRRNHMSLDTVIGMLKANDLSRCREIHLLHLSDGNSDEQAMRKRVQEETGIATYVASS